MTGWQAAVRLDEALASELEGADLVVTGVVASLPQHGRARLLAFPLAPALLPPRELPAEGSFDLVAADLGQDVSVLVRT